ncbi:MAG: tRNA (adenosine(37)-N6)-threonylcarbamoyltransferase complex ATPase subunit type 1 TsaE [Sandaracinaceae bacterium]|nr:tRNA (adenosine(37)-N6)-threonylcarbamoyltransferase complex ATPase subunit type 1 TsaE [Sandaracinaceae bacterium]
MPLPVPVPVPQEHNPKPEPNRAEPLLLTLRSRRATRNLGKALAALLEPGDVVWLEGELGAGKTFFTRGLLRALGVPEAIPVTSPTFALMHEHEGRVAIRHLDLYRLDDAAELDELGIEEALEGAVVVIEWGARFRDAIAARGVEIVLSVPDEGGGRGAALRGVDARGARIVAALASTPSLR